MELSVCAVEPNRTEPYRTEAKRMEPFQETSYRQVACIDDKDEIHT